MTKKDNVPSHGRSEQAIDPSILRSTQEPTQTIDLDSLFTKDITASGSFDLGRVRDISFGKLL
ncbi:MAG: hypothetical protein RDU20_12700, partial [Desulfomonilaceae bacterium]|nr:hypothetical protein [Desulfomonilaceae bacterium]